MMLNSVRTRLTLWYAGVLVLSLIAFGLLTYFAASRTFYERQDETLRSTAETVASAYMQELSEEGSVEKANDVVLSQTIYPDRYVQVTDAAGKPIAYSSNLAGHTFVLSPAQLSEARTRGVSYDVKPGFDEEDDGLRIAIVPLSQGREAGFTVVAESLSDINEDLERLRNDFYAGIPVILLLASLGGYFLARKSLSPIALMDQQTRRITAENLAARLDVPNQRDELGRFAVTINELLERLAAAFAEQQRFIADASHELRTPIAILRGEAEVALERERSEDEYKDSLKLIGEEAERLSHIVEDLFTLARTDLGQRSLRKEHFYLNDLVAECGRAASVLATRKHLSLNVCALPEILMSGDEELLKQMLINLLDNAVKYTPKGGRINVELKEHDGMAEIKVVDTGIGIPLEDQAHIFDRFYRVDKARSRAAGGAGLGLAIVRRIAEAHSGEVIVESEVGQGSTFRAILPLRNGQ